MRTPCREPRRVSRTAFTLTELLMAALVTVLVGMSVATVSAVLSHAQSHSDSMTESIQSGRCAMISIGADVRKAALVTAAGAGELAVWTGDANGDGQINVDELVLIQAVPDDGTVQRWQVAFPDSMSEDLLTALNISKPLAELATTDAVRDLLSGAAYSAYLSKQVLAVDVPNFEVVTDTSPPMSRLVLIRITVGGGGQQITLTSAARLRADATGSVKWVEGIPVLNL